MDVCTLGSRVTFYLKTCMRCIGDVTLACLCLSGWRGADEDAMARAPIE
jgi:hypothetical protein